VNISNAARIAMRFGKAVGALAEAGEHGYLAHGVAGCLFLRERQVVKCRRPSIEVSGQFEHSRRSLVTREISRVLPDALGTGPQLSGRFEMRDGRRTDPVALHEHDFGTR
jgi:hypothetical protein